MVALGFMSVKVRVVMAHVAVRMPARPVFWALPVGVSQPPNKVQCSDTAEAPGRNIPAECLDPLEASELKSHTNPDGAQYHRTHKVSRAAEQDNPQGFGQRPSARAGHCNKGEVVIRPQ